MYASTDFKRLESTGFRLDPLVLMNEPLGFHDYNNSFGSFGSVFVAICLLFFAFSTIIGWYFFVESNVRALFKGSKKATAIYGVIALVFIVVGSFQKVGLVWDMSDMFNSLMVIPNLLAWLALSGMVAKFAKDDDFRG